MADTEATGTEIAHVENTPQSTLAMIARAASDPNVDVAKMQALMTMHERILDRTAKEQFTAAFMELQAVLPRITKRGAITNNSGAVQSRFARWEDIHRVIKPLLDHNGFALRFEVQHAEKGGILETNAVLQHVGGHSEQSGFMPLPADSSGAKNGVQGVGSSMSYGKRYTTIALLNIVTENDTDGVPEVVSDDHERLIIAEATTAAEKGVTAYETHFKALPRATKLMLVNGGHHEKLKALAKDKEAGYVAPKFAGGESDDGFPGDR